MSIDETALRQLLSSAHWRGMRDNILDLVNSGEIVVVEMTDGTEITLTERGEALSAFRERFGWTGQD